MADDQGADSGPGQPVFGDQESEQNPLLSSEDLLTRGRELAISGVPLQLGGLLEALAQLRARAAGSPAAILPSVIGQLSELRGQYANASQAISRRLGFSGGGQTTRDRQRLLTQTAGQYANLFGQQQQQGFSGLLNVQGAIQPALSGAARPPSTGARTSPFDTSLAGTAAFNIGKLAQQLFAPTPVTPGVQPYPELPAASEAALFGSTP